MNSPRIAMFRTHTVQASASNYLSPFPNSPPDTSQNITLSATSTTTIDNLSKITELSSKTIKLMNQLKNLSTRYDKRIKIQREKIEENKKNFYDKEFKERSREESDSEEKISTIKREETKIEVDEDEEEYSRKDIKTIINENAVLYQQIILLSGQLAPIMDRIGRLYTDFSPHLLNNVSSFNNDVRNREHRTNRNRRNRRQQNRESQRNISEDNSRQSDEELDDEANNSSDSLSRDSNDSNNRGNNTSNRDQNGNREIRSRLRSISNTISRIRSSISSMRTLIFNNLGRGDHPEGDSQSRFGIDERGERQIIVNPQIPIISSPGDIASVHNIFDRFIDRQMVNMIGGEPNQNNRQNRSNQNANPQNNANEPSERVNIESENNSNNRNRRSTGNAQRPGDFLSQLMGDTGPLGLLNSEFGGVGFGGGSETIEFHIHAFVPSNNREENQPQNNFAANLNVQSSSENSNSRNANENNEDASIPQNQEIM